MMKKLFILLFFVIFSIESVGYCKTRQKWQEKKTKNFVIYYRNVPDNFVKNVKEAAERNFKEITTDLGFRRYASWSFDDRAQIFIYDNKDDYVLRGRQAKWSHAMTSAKQKIIQTFPSAVGFFDTTLPHELGHIIFHEFVGENRTIPLWFDEGVAMLQEKGQRFGVDKMVFKAMQDKTFIPLEELSLMKLTKKTPVDTITLFYAEAASVLNYMMEKLGRQKFLNFCELLRDHETFDQALSHVYGRVGNIKDLNAYWMRYLKEKHKGK